MQLGECGGGITEKRSVLCRPRQHLNDLLHCRTFGRNTIVLTIHGAVQYITQRVRPLNSVHAARFWSWASVGQYNEYGFVNSIRTACHGCFGQRYENSSASTHDYACWFICEPQILSSPWRLALVNLVVCICKMTFLLIWNWLNSCPM